MTPTSAASAKAASRAAIVPSAVVYAFQFTAVGVWVAYATVYFEAQGVDLAMIGVLAAIPAAVAIVAAPAWGLLADRMGDMRPPYLAASLWAATAALILTLGPSMPWLGIVVLAVAIGTSGMTPLLDARTVQRLWPHRERFGQARAFGSLAFMVSTVAVGALIAATGLAAMFVVYAAALAGAGIASWLLLGRPDRRLRIGGVGPLAALGLLRSPGLGLFWVGSVVVWIAAIGSMTLFSLVIVDLGGDPSMIGIGWALGVLLEIPVMVLFPRMARRVPVVWLIVIGACVFVVRSVLWSLTASLVPFIAASMLGGIGFALVLVGTTAYVASRVPPGLQATGQALFSSTTFSIGSITGAILAGQIAARGGLEAVYPASVITSAVGAVLVWIAIARPGRREQSAATPVAGHQDVARS